LVYAPITQASYSACQNTSAYDSLFTELGPYHNFNGKLPLVDSLHFYDAHHLNQEGVEIFNQAVLEILSIKP
ncbi:MAG: hypothetical protein AAFR59_07965, partial [Bacteroidota bacterium]